MGNRWRDCQGGLQAWRGDVYPPVMTKADERAKRLADALRENLRRRKAQPWREETPPRAKREDEPEGPNGELP